MRTSLRRTAFLFSLSLLICLTAAFSSFALEKTYEFPDIFLRFTLPDGWLAATQDPADNEELAALLEVSEEELSAYLADGNILLDAIDYDTLYETGELLEIFLLWDEDNKDATSVYDFNDLTEEDLKAFSPNYDDIKEYDSGANPDISSITQYEVTGLYTHAQAKFLVQTMTQADTDGEEIHILIYMTILNGKAVSTWLRVPRELTADDTALMEDIVDRMVFTQVTENPNKTNGSFLYSILKIAALLAILVFFALFKKRGKNSPVTEQPHETEVSAERMR